VSLEVVMEDPGGFEDSVYGGWSFEVSRGDEGGNFKLEKTRNSEAIHALGTPFRWRLRGSG
jgi:hypothetical protein